MVYTLDMKLTKKQKIMLDFIDGFIKGNGYSPTKTFHQATILSNLPVLLKLPPMTGSAPVT
jgi:SOS-response transcriptional repressor LexA